LEAVEIPLNRTKKSQKARRKFLFVSDGIEIGLTGRHGSNVRGHVRLRGICPLRVRFSF
jgi:hypothetical protein